MRRSRWLSGIALVSLGLALAGNVRPGAVWAQDDEAAGEKADPAALAFFNKGLKAMGKNCASKLWSVAADATKQGFHAFALREAKRVLVFDPDNKNAREHLGYVKKKKKWELDGAASGKVKKQNVKNVKESQKSFDKRVEKWKTRKGKAEAFIASKYAQLGAACANKGYEDQAAKCYRRALSYDKNCAAARKGLGYRQVGKVWVTEKQMAAIKVAMDGKPVTEQSRLEKGLGVKLHKMESPHFRVEDDGGIAVGSGSRGVDLKEQIKTLETLYAYYLADAGIDPTTDVFEGKKLEMCVVTTQPLWERWVDKFSTYKDKAWLKQSNTYRDIREKIAGTLRVETAEHVDTRDPLLHHAAHVLTFSVWGINYYAWLDEGLAYYYTVKVNETTRTHCVAKSGGGYAEGPEIGGDKDWAVSEMWRQYLRQMVRGKNDVDLRGIVNKKLETLDLPQTVKAWGVISWLMDKHRTKTLAMLEALKENRNKRPAPEVIEEVFGRTLEDIDKAWRAYAVRAY